MTDCHPIITTTHGCVKGLWKCSVYNDNYYSFEKIPYAQPPINNLRFKAPQPITPWAEVRECYQLDVKPLQQNYFKKIVEGSEDCLYLNVYAKKLISSKPLPVMIYLYGGGFELGDATTNNLGPDYFMMEDVILVTMNYRLGPLGFLSFEDPSLDIPGNAGLKDQLMAIKWFKENCLNFNGDPDNITLFGESAGSAAAHLLMMSEKTRGLFHKAILMSGTINNKWACVPSGNYAYRLAKATGYDGEESDPLILRHLQQVPSAKLTSVDVLTEEEIFNDVAFVWGPIVEPYDSPSGLITHSLDKLLTTSWSNEIPLIVGGTSFEGLLKLPSIKKRPQRIDILNEKPELIVPQDIRLKKTLEECQSLGRQILKMYFDKKDLNIENVLNYLEILSYTRYWIGFQFTIFQRLRYATRSPTYMYRFDYDSPTFNLYRLKYCGREVRGAAHADDVSYLFYCRRAWKLPLDSLEYLTIRRMIGMWTSFANTSNPNCKEIQSSEWTCVSDKQPFAALNISDEVQMLNELPETEKLKFWLSLYNE